VFKKLYQSVLIPPLDIEGEWRRLTEIVQELPYAIIVERTRLSTIDRLRSLLANQSGRVVHFMGHGGEYEKQAALLFENEQGFTFDRLARD
jgi:hypothetical protein